VPLAIRIRNNWNDRIVPTYGDDRYLDFDRDQIEVLKEHREKLWLRVDSSRELTINEKREAKGYEPKPGGDVLLVGAADVWLDSMGR
jgi:phage portal protein BeeE